ncbi:alpha-E domain-containing protein [Vibrio sp. Y2-5]|uniref:alpha-E domain-containing protein n=1 Tax=Vibrio TaxID=662 RepID=UPI00142E078C|nr:MULTISPECIES: alpha-E domain-containing protein [Vibrio]MBD0785448.1 alpha-E domain-containing protein [Vibrio sp. Y2-5]NIY92284.1 alpha-E domain-containing protein [Vibrio diazotrophicus]
MLSRVAERLYWSARYLERVENIARLLNVYDELLYDLPRDIRISWYNLIEINGSVIDYTSKYKDHGERNVVKYLLSDMDNPSSLLASLNMVRENIRTSRDVVPEEMWEQINELNIYAKKHIQTGINRSNRHVYLNEIIEGCQKVIGLLANAMRRDAGWSFIILGRYLERADMNTRILDSAVSIMNQSSEEERLHLEQVLWSKVLKSQSAYLNYRRTMRASVTGEDAATFLLMDEFFPRSQTFCLTQLKIAAEALPSAEEVVVEVNRLLQNTNGVENAKELNIEFSNYLNDVQLAIIDLHSQIRETWFHFRHGEAA